MKAITLWQPWGSLVAIGAKGFETRSWHTTYRGPIAIHAATKRPTSMWDIIEPIIDRVRAALGIVDPDALPRGAVIATGELVECWKVTAHGLLSVNGGLVRFEDMSDDELSFGDFTPGRYTWEIVNVQLLSEPIPAKGKQGLWNWRSA